MSEHPILFSTNMVKSIQAGKKTQTRRVIKVQPPTDKHRMVLQLDTTSRERRKHNGKYHWAIRDGLNVTEEQVIYFKCPYGKVGDKLWVREGFRCTGGGSERNLLYRADGGDSALSFCGINDGRSAAVQKQHWVEWDRLTYETKTGCNWRPSIHMPRWASRILSEITDIRVERVQEITDAAVLAEGIEQQHIEKYRPFLHKNDIHGAAFGELWDSINSKRIETYFNTVKNKDIQRVVPGYSWESNPWVWVVEFKRV